MFRGITIKSCAENNFGRSDDRKYDKIIVKELVLFLNDLWVDVQGNV